MNDYLLFIVLGICLIAVLFVVFNYIKIKLLPEGNEKMVKENSDLFDLTEMLI